jgi:hypothetical protein
MLLLLLEGHAVVSLLKPIKPLTVFVAVTPSAFPSLAAKKKF